MTQAYNLFEKIQKLINSSRFNESFLLLKRELKNYPSLAKELDKIKETEGSYRHMLAYLAAGHDDPSRADMTEKVREDLYNANELLMRENLLTDSSDSYFSTRRLFNLRNESLLHQLEKFNEALKEDSEEVAHIKEGSDSHNMVGKISPKQARALEDVFNYVWTMKGAPAEDYETLTNTIENPLFPDYFKSQLISAIILGNISFFDPAAVHFLITAFENSSSPDVKARSLIGILLISLLHPNRIAGNISLKSRLMLSADDDELKTYLNDILLNIIRTYDTKRIDNKMRTEVIPGLMKIKPEIIDKMKNMTSDAENFLSDVNPEWEEILENSGIGEKLQEINDMQLEGADVMVTAFSNLKSFPFFNSVANWFLPFSPGFYEFTNLPFDKDEDTAALLTTVMCDSDLHSFLLSMNSMPEGSRNQMLRNMESQMKEAHEALTDAIGDNEQKILKRKINHALQDLYRFFKFYRKKSEFKDPFEEPFLASHIEKVMSWLGIKQENIRLVAEFYFKNKYYDEAAGMFELVDRLDPGDFNNWEKIGYCYDRVRLFDKAVEWYSKAEIINPGNPWLEKKMAVALKNAGKTKEALNYYRNSLDREPENYHLLMSMAQCLVDNNQTEEALQHLYHAQYLKPHKLDVLRAIAWTHLMSGNLEKANENYAKVKLHPEADKTDFLNAAHALLASGNFKEALKDYRNFVDRSQKQDTTELVIAFRDDANLIKKLGIKMSDLRLIVDKIRYDIQPLLP